MAISGKKIILVGPEEVEKLSLITCLKIPANDNLNAKKDDLKEYKYPFLFSKIIRKHQSQYTICLEMK